MDAGDIAQLNVVIGSTTSSDKWENVFHFECQIDATSLYDLADEFNTHVLTDWMHAGMVNEVNCALLAVRDAVPGTAAGVDFVVSPAKTGGDAISDMLPPTASAIITWRTALAGRAYRGRSYLPGFGEAQQAGGILNAGCITDMEAAVTAMLGRFGPGGTSGNWRLVVLSRVLNGVVRPTPVGTLVVSGDVQTIMGSQRRRRPGVGS